MTDIHFNEYTWPQVRNVVAKADKELAQILDDWNPGKEYTFIELEYPFGSHILDVNKGGFQIPKINGQTIPFTDSSIPSSLKTKLDYSYLPIGMLIQGGAEVYHKLNDRVFSLAYFNDGLNLGIWEAFGPPAPFSVTAGARSLIMAPKITDVSSHKKLQVNFKFRQPVPRNLFDQWNIFVELAKHLKEPWTVKILFLNNKWMEPKNKNIGWLNFHNYLQKKAWQHTEYTRSKSLFEVSWKHFCSILQDRGERFDPYLIETLRHIIFMGQGALPAFAAVAGSELYGPIQFLMKIYIDIYGLKNYVPTFLAPAHYGKTFKKSVPLYYSFQNPTIIETIPKIKTFSSAIDDMRNFKALMEYFIEESLSKNLRLGNEQLIDSLQNVKFDYFHSEMFTYGGIHPSIELSKYDQNLLFMPEKSNTTKVFADKGSFFRCCLRISEQ